MHQSVSWSRATSRSSRSEKGRREIQIPQVAALDAFIQRCVAPAGAVAAAGAAVAAMH